MKKISLALLVIAIAFLWSCSGESKKEAPEKVSIVIEKDNYKPGEKDALVVLKAYAEKDAETLKSYVDGMRKSMIDDKYFTSKGISAFVDRINGSKGEFTDIRYKKERVNFEDYYYLDAAFYTSPEGQVSAIGLKSKDKEKWILSGFGNAYLKSEDFGSMSTDIPE